MPCRFAEHHELEALCAVLGERGRMLQIVHEFYDPGLTVSRDRDAGRPVAHATASRPRCRRCSTTPRWRDGVRRRSWRPWSGSGPLGARVWPQVQTRPIDISWTLDQRSIMFLVIPGWWPVLSLPTKADKLAAFADPAPATCSSTASRCWRPCRARPSTPARFVVREVALDRNRDLVGRTLGDIAAERGTTPAELLIDLAVEEDLGTWFIRADIGHADPKAVGALLAHPYVHVGASDGGAHVGSFATYGDTGYLFSRFVRDTGALRLEEAVKKITSDTCAIWGLPDGGFVREGYAADLAVFDPATIDRGPEVASDDFPGEGLRWIRRSVGMDAVVVGGTVTWSAADGYVPGARAGVIASR